MYRTFYISKTMKDKQNWDGCLKSNADAKYVLKKVEAVTHPKSSLLPIHAYYRRGSALVPFQ